MQIFHFQNKKKDAPKYPDFIVKNIGADLVGACWLKKDKNNEAYFSSTINMEDLIKGMVRDDREEAENISNLLNELL